METKTTTIIEQFIPIIFIFLLFTYPKTVVTLSHSVLGRLVAVFIIIYYSLLDKYLGLLVCGLTIFYYQMDYVEGMLETMNENFDNLLEYVPQIDISTIVDTTKGNITTLLNNSYKQFTYYQDLYLDTPNQKSKHISSTINSKAEFIKDNCDKDGNLLHKESIINLEMIEHLFPEIKFTKNKCNPCINTCEFTILEQKLITEDKMKPISTMM